MLITTDPFARCLDSQKVTLAFNYELLKDTKEHGRRVNTFKCFVIMYQSASG